MDLCKTCGEEIGDWLDGQCHDCVAADILPSPPRMPAATRLAAPGTKRIETYEARVARGEAVFGRDSLRANLD